MLSPREDANRRLLRARDAMDRRYAQPLDVPALAAVAYMSAVHFTREFKATFGETPHRYLQRRRVERAMTRLRDTDDAVTEIALSVGFSSIGTFGRTFRDIVGRSPSEYREVTRPVAVPGCFVRAWTRPAGERPGTVGLPSSFGEAAAPRDL
ncbi:helix-turn-helix transcriptional regulator [Tsukamurella soli]|uniref:Helix-turn-helix transcriptional regulator n=1 Tax=Tsukamurella soli TaxID=644556 RepID=A0ABP8KJI6_9ACTN